MRLVWNVLRALASLALVTVAGTCIWRGLRLLYFAANVSRGRAHPPTFSGIPSALGYFVAGVLVLAAAMSVWPPKAMPNE